MKMMMLRVYFWEHDGAELALNSGGMNISGRHMHLCARNIKKEDGCDGYL